MLNYFDFNKHIIELKRNKEYEEILSFFKKNKNAFPIEQIAHDNYLIPTILISLRKTNNSKFINSFLREYSIHIDDKAPSIILNLYGWAVYDNIKNKDYLKDDVLKYIQEIITILQSQDDEFSYNIISNIFRVSLQYAKESQNVDFHFIKALCELFSVEKLSIKPQVLVIKGKEIEQGSDKEKWYSELSKAYFELKMYNESFELSKEALSILDTFHFNNDSWFARRLALSKKHLGNLEDAINDLEVIYSKKPEWFIQKEIAELFFEKSDFEKSLQNGISAVLSKGKIEFKVSLIMLLGKILKQKKDIKNASLHFLLVKYIRSNNGWKVSEELENELVSIEENQDIEYKELIIKLKSFWEQYLKDNKVKKHSLESKQELYKGVIKKIIHNNERGKSGFIESQKGSYYFSMPSHITLVNLIEESKNVKFKVEKSRDGRNKAKIIELF